MLHKSSEESLSARVMALFLTELRHRNPSFFPTHFIQFLATLTQKKANKDLPMKELDHALAILVNQLQNSKSGGGITNSDHGLEMLVRTIENLKSKRGLLHRRRGSGGGA